MLRQVNLHKKYDACLACHQRSGLGDVAEFGKRPARNKS